MTYLQYAKTGMKTQDYNIIPTSQWPLFGGTLISSDTTRLGPEGKQSTYIDEKYRYDDGNEVYVSKSLYPDGYRSISILNNGQEFIQGYRPDGSINYKISPEQSRKDTMNYYNYSK